MPEINTTSLRNAYKKRNAIKFGTITGVILLVCGIVAVIIYNEKTSVYSGYTVIADAPLPYANVASVYELDGNILLVGNDGAILSDALGNQIWNRTYQIKTPIVSTGKNYVAIAGFGENQLYLCDNKSPNTIIDTVLPISAVCVSDNGVSGVILRDAEFDRINLYNKEGEKLMEMQCSPGDYGIPYAICLSPDATIFMAAFADVYDGHVITKLNFYSFDNIGLNYVDHLVSSYTLDDAVSPYIAFLNNASQAAVSNVALSFYAGDKIPKQIMTQMTDGRILSVMAGNSKLGIIRADASGMQYALEVYNAKAQKECAIGLTKAYNNIALSEKYIIAYDASSLMIATYGGDIKYSGEFDGQIKLIIPKAANKCLIVAANQAVTVRLE